MAKAQKPTSNKKKVAIPDKCTATTISDYLAEKHEIPKKQAKEILEDLFEIINAGVMRGERVPLGKMGKVFVKVKPATKARIGRNPITGDEIKIPAKKATKVPKFSFTKNFKAEALKAKIKESK